LSSGLITLAQRRRGDVEQAVVAPIIRAFGFRNVLIANTMISSAFLFAIRSFSRRRRIL